MLLVFMLGFLLCKDRPRGLVKCCNGWRQLLSTFPRHASSRMNTRRVALER